MKSKNNLSFMVFDFLSICSSTFLLCFMFTCLGCFFSLPLTYQLALQKNFQQINLSS